MTDTDQLIDRNRRFAKAFAWQDLAIMPKLATIVLACLDARVDPTHIFDLDPGDAGVMRNAGGRVTPDVLRDLGVLGFLAANAPGLTKMRPELVIVHHTDCGMSRLASPEVQHALAERLGLDLHVVETMAITDPALSVASDVEMIRHAPGVPNGFLVSGYVYDVASGVVTEVVAPGSREAVA